MSTFYRKLLVWSILFGIVVIGVWSSLAERLPPADFTFANESEVKSIDPALVTGQPEGRIAYALFDGLVRNDPETLEPLPGIAKRWEISDDKLTYKMFLRDDARWSDGSPVTAQDFHYSWRRLLNPRTAAEYAYQGWYFKNGRRYSQGGSGITPGDSVEVELNLPPGALNTLRGQVLRGELVRVVEREKDTRDYVVRIEGTEVCFRPTDDVEELHRRQEPVAGGGEVGEHDVPALLTTEGQAVVGEGEDGGPIELDVGMPTRARGVARRTASNTLHATPKLTASTSCGCANEYATDDRPARCTTASDSSRTSTFPTTRI